MHRLYPTSKVLIQQKCWHQLFECCNHFAHQLCGGGTRGGEIQHSETRLLSVCYTAKGTRLACVLSLLISLLIFSLIFTVNWRKLLQSYTRLNIYTRDMLSAFPVQTTSVVLIDSINRRQTEIKSVKKTSNNDTKWRTSALLCLENPVLCQMTTFGIEQFPNERI